ncbi:MAG: cupin domain-containing protein [Clostridia bacterium]|nr:cupin domain-containing protein [Clostridia bacterium]
MAVNSKAGTDGMRADSVVRRLLHSGDGYTAALMHGAPSAGAAPHSHMQAQFIYILRGGGTLQNGTEQCALKAGQAAAIAPDTPHTFIRLDEETDWLEFFVPERHF